MLASPGTCRHRCTGIAALMDPTAAEHSGSVHAGTTDFMDLRMWVQSL